MIYATQTQDYEKLTALIDGPRLPGVSVTGIPSTPQREAGILRHIADWYINVTFTKDADGWDALDKILQALETPPPPFAPLDSSIVLYPWSDAGLRWSICATEPGPGEWAEPGELLQRLEAVLDQWEEGW